jgi:hypothetical protein
VAVTFSFLLVWGGGGGLRFEYYIYIYSFGFRVLGFGGGCFWNFFKNYFRGKG